MANTISSVTTSNNATTVCMRTYLTTTTLTMLLVPKMREDLFAVVFVWRSNHELQRKGARVRYKEKTTKKHRDLHRFSG